MKRLVILNPTSRHGAAEREFTAQRAGWEEKLGAFDVYLTRSPGDATDKVRSVLRDGGFDQIIVAGGDGTINEAFSGYWVGDQITNETIPLGIINLGTGGDFYRSVRSTSADYESALVENRFRMVDAGLVLPEPGGAPRPFLNIASVGMAAAMLRSLKASRFQSGAAGYFYHTLKTLLRYRPQLVMIDYIDAEGGTGQLEVELINLFVCNGRFSGGGMHWSPGACLDDGLLRLTLITGTRKWSLVCHAGKIYQGRVSELPGARVIAVRELTVTCAGTLGMETDGEILAMNGSTGTVARFAIKPTVFPLIL